MDTGNFGTDAVPDAEVREVQIFGSVSDPQRRRTGVVPESQCRSEGSKPVVEIIFQEALPGDSGLYHGAAESTERIARDNPKSGVAAGSELTGNTENGCVLWQGIGGKGITGVEHQVTSENDYQEVGKGENYHQWLKTLNKYPPIFFGQMRIIIMNGLADKIINKHLGLVSWKPARAVAELVAAGMSESEAEALVKSRAPARKKTKEHKPHNSHAKPVNLEALSTHYIVVGDYDLLSLKHQDALIAAIRNGKGRSSWKDESMAVTLFGLVKAYPVITTAEVNKYLNRAAFIDSIPLFIDGEVVEGDLMPSADNDAVKGVFRAVKQLQKITDHLAATGELNFQKYLTRVPTDEDVQRAVGIVMPVIRNPHYHDIDYDRMYQEMPVAGHREDSKRIIREWKEDLKEKGSKCRQKQPGRDITPAFAHDVSSEGMSPQNYGMTGGETE